MCALSRARADSVINRLVENRLHCELQLLKSNKSPSLVLSGPYFVLLVKQWSSQHNMVRYLLSTKRAVQLRLATPPTRVSRRYM